MAGNPYRKTTKQFKSEVYDLVGNDYKVLGDYQTAKQKIKMRHEPCGFEYEITPNNFLSGVRCRNCAGNQKKRPSNLNKKSLPWLERRTK